MRSDSLGWIVFLCLSLVMGCDEKSAASEQEGNTDTTITIENQWGSTPGKEKSLEDICKRITCRDERKEKISLANGEEIEIPIPRYPYTDSESVFLFPNEKVLIECQAVGDRLIRLSYVQKNLNPHRTLVFDFKQEKKGEQPVMVLSVENPFPKFLKYKASIYSPKKKTLIPTSVCPVMSNHRFAFESWPYPIVQLVLDEFRLIQEGSLEAKTCGK